ncbi:Adhesin family protein [Granulibacter bethesdensis]|uniref:Adhesin family protein n=1 Tax=Granulibacter bethesdensis TaxID=364410 RepID=A0AAN0VG06_9PROT|nr:hypothetical protein [Granulibacter bethesdensis]AHJ63357.1 Adhesin family protein [Granulibacter bethesdensis]
MASNVTVPGGNTPLSTVSLDYNRNLAPITTQLLSSIYAAEANNTLQAVDNPTASPTVAAANAIALITSSMSSVPTGFSSIIIGATSQPGAVSNVVVNNTNTIANQAVIFGTAGGYLETGAGQGTILGSLGANTIMGTGGNWNIQTDQNSPNIAGSYIKGQTSTIVLNALGADTYIGGTGNATLAAFSGNSLFYGGKAGTSTQFTNNSRAGTGNATYVGASGDSTVFANNVNGLYQYQSGSMAFVNGSGSNTMFGGSGASTLFAGTGQSLFVLSNGQTKFMATGGSQTVYGANVANNGYFSSNATINLVGNTTGGNQLVAVGGNNILSTAFSDSGNILKAGSGSDTLFGSQGNGNDTMFSGTGSATMFGGGGHDIFVLSKGMQATTIFNFNTSSTLSLNGWGVDAENAAVTNQVNDAAGTHLTLNDNTTITLIGVSHLNSGQVFNS